MSDQPPSTIPSLLAGIVASRGDAEAIVTRAQAVTYRQLDRRTSRMARAMLAAGAGKGTRIALMAPDGVLWLTAFLAGLRIGAVMVTVSTLCTPSELGYILRHGDAQLLIGVRRFLRHDYAETLAAAFPALATQRPGRLRLPEAPYLRSIWLEGDDRPGWSHGIDDLLALADEPGAPDDLLLERIEQEVCPSDDAVVIYTSGSTAAPKAVVHRQWTLARHPPVLAQHFLLEETDRMMPLLPLFWVGGLAMALEVLGTGATLVYPDSPATDVVLDTLTQLNVNRVNSWGPQQVRLREAAVARGIDIEKIGGLAQPRDAQDVPIPPHLQVNMLGMTESFCPHSSEPLDTRLPEDKAGSSGRGIGGIERRIVDPATGEPLAPGTVGELQLRGGAMMAGFYKVDRRDVFTPDGFYPTNDLARIDADGHLYFVGRRGDMLKTAGVNVSRLEVQAVLGALPDVDLGVVVGLADRDLGQIVAAAVVPRPGRGPTEASLKDQLRQRLSSYKIPKHIVFIESDEVQWTPSGKVRLDALAGLITARVGMR